MKTIIATELTPSVKLNLHTICIISPPVGQCLHTKRSGTIQSGKKAKRFHSLHNIKLLLYVILKHNTRGCHFHYYKNFFFLKVIACFTVFQTLSKTLNASLISSSLSVSFIFLAIIVRNSGKSIVPLPNEPHKAIAMKKRILYFKQGKRLIYTCVPCNGLHLFETALLISPGKTTTENQFNRSQHKCAFNHWSQAGRCSMIVILKKEMCKGVISYYKQLKYI